MGDESERLEVGAWEHEANEWVDERGNRADLKLMLLLARNIKWHYTQIKNQLVALNKMLEDATLSDTLDRR